MTGPGRWVEAEAATWLTADGARYRLIHEWGPGGARPDVVERWVPDPEPVRESFESGWYLVRQPGELATTRVLWWSDLRLEWSSGPIATGIPWHEGDWERLQLIHLGNPDRDDTVDDEVDPNDEGLVWHD